MQQALLCTTAPAKAVFGAKQHYRYRHCACTVRRAAASALKRSRGDSSSCMLSTLNMPHANSSVRRDTAARAEERDSLMVSKRQLADVLIPTRRLFVRDPHCSAQQLQVIFLSQPCLASHLPLQEAPRAQASSPAVREVDWIMTFLVFVFPAVGGLLFGYDIGATSGALVSITSEKTSGTDW